MSFGILSICFPDVHSIEWIFAIPSSHVNVGNDLLRLLPLSLEVSVSHRDTKT